MVHACVGAGARVQARAGLVDSVSCNTWKLPFLSFLAQCLRIDDMLVGGGEGNHLRFPCCGDHDVVCVAKDTKQK